MKKIFLNTCILFFFSPFYRMWLC